MTGTLPRLIVRASKPWAVVDLRPPRPSAASARLPVSACAAPFTTRRDRATLTGLMPTRRRRGRAQPSPHADAAPVASRPRFDDPSVRVDPTWRLTPEVLHDLLRGHGVEPQDWMGSLEQRVGGIHFGEHYAAVRLGFRNSFLAYVRTGIAAPLRRTPDGRALLCFGIEGDTYYLLTEQGEAWALDGIADKDAHREAASFDALSAQLNWPAVTRAMGHTDGDE